MDHRPSLPHFRIASPSGTSSSSSHCRVMTDPSNVLTLSGIGRIPGGSAGFPQSAVNDHKDTIFCWILQNIRKRNDTLSLVMKSLKSECVCKQHTSAVQCRFCPQPVFFAEDGRIPLADVIFDTAVHNFWSLRGWSWGLNESVGDTWGHSTVRYKNQTDHCNMLMVS